MELSSATTEALIAEIEGMSIALNAFLGRPFDGREEGLKAELQNKIEVFQAEVNRRNAQGT
ncbi:MAG: hypothetical protein AB1592_14585 [Pseudomonadota bacterium]